MRRELPPTPVAGLRAAMATRYRAKAARADTRNTLMAGHFRRQAELWESGEVLWCKPWQLPPEYRPVGFEDWQCFEVAADGSMRPVTPLGRRPDPRTTGR